MLHTHTHTHTRAHAHMHTHARTHTTHAHMHTHVHMHTHARTRTHTCTRTHARHARTHARTHTHTYYPPSHTHTHTSNDRVIVTATCILDYPQLVQVHPAAVCVCRLEQSDVHVRTHTGQYNRCLGCRKADLCENLPRKRAPDVWSYRPFGRVENWTGERVVRLSPDHRVGLVKRL